MTRNEALALRNLIHSADIAAREERSALVAKRERLEKIQEIERERALASEAASMIWEMREAPEGYTDPAIKLWRALRRAASVNFTRWAPILITVENLFRGKSLLPVSK